MIQDYKKLHSWNKRFSSTYIASFNEASDKSVWFSSDKLAMFHLYQESLKSPFTPVTAIVESSNPNTCLVSSLSSHGSLILEP